MTRHHPSQGEPTPRQMPAHIANLLQRRAPTQDAAATPADSAGIPWQGRDLSGEGNPLHTFDGDDGRITSELSRARDALLAGELDEAGFVAALRGQRLFVPVIATLAEQGQAHDAGPIGDKEAEIAVVHITSASGRPTMPIFTSVDTLTAWHHEARPVAAETERILLAALAEGSELVVLDPGADLPFVLRRPAVEALAQGQEWTPSYQDPQIAAALEDIVDQCLGVRHLVMAPGTGVATVSVSGATVSGGGSGPELRIGVALQPGVDAIDARLALASVQASVEELTVVRRRADSVEVVLARDSG